MIEQLKEFHQAVHNKTGSKLSSLGQTFEADNATAKLRADLILEEADELAHALYEEDEAQALKELCDLLYVAIGTAVTYNWPIEQAFHAVHRDNMNKLTSGTLGKNGKYVKPKGWKKVDLKPLLDAYRKTRAAQAQQEFKFFE